MTQEAPLVVESKDTEARYGRMDELLLNLSASIGILFTLIQAAISGVNSIILFSPLLLMGWVLPIYVGYMRGAIQNSMQERIRGWIYLVVGVLIYCAHIGLDLLHVSGTGGQLEFLSVIFPSIAVALEATIVVAYGQLLTAWILGVSKEQVEPDISMISRTTQCSAFFLSLGLEYIVREYVSQSSGAAAIWVYVIAAIMISWGLISFKVSESWSVMSKNTEIVRTEPRKLGRLSRLVPMFIPMLAGIVALGLGIYLTQSNEVLSNLLIAAGLLLLLSPALIGWLSPEFMVQIHSAKVKAMPQPKRDEITTAVSWIEAVEKIRKTVFVSLSDRRVARD